MDIFEKDWKSIMKDRRLAFISFILLMMALGSNDSLKGIFSAIFQTHFKLTTAQLSTIVTVSYLGNLVFLMVGGKLADKYQRRTMLLVFIAIWLGALALFILTDNYYCLLAGMFLSMGSSTFINTTLNIVTPVLFSASPGFAVNFLFFTQGIGTSGSQSLIGNYAANFTAWQLTNEVLLGVGLVAFGILAVVKIPETPVDKRVSLSFTDLVRNKAFIFLFLIFGLYFVAEHGILNWLIVYGVNALNLSMGKAANYLAIFFGGITMGRLVLSPLVDKLGVVKSIRLFSAISAVLYIVGMIFGGRTILLLSFSGFFMAIIYPTLVMMIGKIFPAGNISTVTGMIISAASVFDILFNAMFGRLSDMIGYQSSILLLPLAMGLYVCLFYMFAAKIRPTESSITESGKLDHRRGEN